MDPTTLTSDEWMAASNRLVAEAADALDVPEFYRVEADEFHVKGELSIRVWISGCDECPEISIEPYYADGEDGDPTKPTSWTAEMMPLAMSREAATGATAQEAFDKLLLK